MSLKEHHKAWLDSHPNHDEVWLLTSIAAGFDVHHVDEDKTNNDPDNLLMIERSDHMKIHGLHSFLNKKDNPAWDNYANRIGRGESAYKIRSETSQTWMEIAGNMGYKRESQVLNVAKAYALYHKLQWPIPHHQDCNCSWCGNKGFKESKKRFKKKHICELTKNIQKDDFVLMCINDDGSETQA